MTSQKPTQPLNSSAVVAKAIEAGKYATRVRPLSEYPWKPSFDVEGMRKVVRDVREQSIKAKRLIAD